MPGRAGSQTGECPFDAIDVFAADFVRGKVRKDEKVYISQMNVTKGVS